MIDMAQVIEDMKPKMKEHPVLKKHLDKMVADGLTEDEALDVMIEVWLTQGRR